MSPNVNNFIKNLNNDLKPYNVLKLIKKEVFSSSSVTNTIDKDVIAYYLPILAGAATSLVALNLKTQKINDDNALQEVYEIDKEAFAQIDPYENFEDFKTIIRESNLSTYSISDESGNILGYYQLEPANDGDLYIDSMGLKKEFRRTKKGYQAIKFAWAEIIKNAAENDVKTLSLHVNMEDKALLNMYTKMGFVVKETLPNYYENGATALYMVLEMPTNVAEADNAEQVVTLSPKEKAEKGYVDACEKVVEELKSQNFEKGKIATILEYCSYRDKNGFPVFSEQLKNSYLELMKIFSKNDSLDFDISDIFKKMLEKNSFGEPAIKPETLLEVKNLSRANFSSYEIKNILDTARIKDKINVACLKFAGEIYLGDNNYYRHDMLKNLLNDDGSFNEDVANLYRYCFSVKIKPSDLQDITKVMVEIKDGKKNVKPISVLQKIREEVDKSSSRMGIYTYYSLEGIAEACCDIEDYFEYYDKVTHLMNKRVNSDEAAAIIKACLTRRKTGFNKAETTKGFDTRLFSIYKKYEEELINENTSYKDAENIRKALGCLIDACKVYDEYRGDVFDEKIFEKAMLLKERGVPLVESKDRAAYSVLKDVSFPLVEMINLCKKEKTNWLDAEEKSISFDDGIFNKVIEKLNEEPIKFNSLFAALKFAKDYNPNEKSEYFNIEAFDYYYQIHSTQSVWHYWAERYDEILRDTSRSPQIKMDVLRTIAQRASTHRLDRYIDVFKVNLETDEVKRTFNFDALQALEKLNQMNYILNDEAYKDDKFNNDISLLLICRERDDFGNDYFSQSKFNKLVAFLEKGFTAKDAGVFQYKTYGQIVALEKLLEQGIDLKTATYISNNCYDEDGNVDEEKLQRCLELRSLGLVGSQLDVLRSSDDLIADKIGILEEKNEFNEISYTRLKNLIEKGLSPDLIYVCRDNRNFSDRLFKLLMNLKEKGYPNDSLKGLMEVCFARNYPSKVGFSQNIYDKIFELEKLGIDKNEIANVLKSCKYQSPDFEDTKFSEEAYKKIPELYYKDYDEKGIAKILEKSVDKETKTFSQERFEQILKLSAQHKRLRDVLNNDDGKVIVKLLDNEAYVNSTLENFGDDVVNYAISMRVGGFTSFAQNCNNLLSKMSSDFISELKQRLDLLSSPELKVKRLQILGALSSKVSEQSLTPLLRMIESTKMTDTQKEVANAIFANESLSLDEQIERFVKELDVPKKNKEYIINYLREARLDKQINRPAPLIEQLKQMEEYAQQMLTNSKIPLEKKIKYIDEFKAKIADMQADPEKYTAPRLFPKVMKELQTVVEAYINIPNSDIKMNNAIYETTYSHLGIESTVALLENIVYDSKYFDRLLVTGSKFRNNFKNLIELVKLNEGKLLEEMRITLPEEGTPEYEKYERFGLIKQIKANLDTKRQFEEVGLDFARWNSYDKDLISDSFNVEIDTEQEYNNLRCNIINELYGELINKIKEDEVDKLFKKLSDSGFVFINKEILYLGQNLTNASIEKLINGILKYTEQNPYWQNLDENSKMTLEEKESINGFLDHVKGFKKKFEDIQNGKNVSNLRLRLANMNDIGRNIFFGNHVSCCNKVESDYAGYSAPLHLINSYIRGMEIVDEFGNSYGNSQCYFALIDGKVTFVIDSFEANGKLASNPIVTENIVNYAKQVCKAMGCEDAPIVFGPRYNNLSLDDYESTIVSKFKVLGTVSAPTYCDTLGGLNIQDQINSIQNNLVVHTHKAS